jgi:poly-gamma-glutamate synthesis protein (capsule biosynthesis protein)
MKESSMNRKICRLVITFFFFLFLANLGASYSLQEEDTFTMALTGDSIISQRLRVFQEPEFLKMIDLIRSTDVAFTNLETLFHDYEPYPMHQSGGTYMRAEPYLAKEFVWAGFDMVSRANNHTGDYGVMGMRLTTKYVLEAGLVDAGVGESLLAAREARFLETAKARVALVSCASTFPDHCRASKSRGDIPARPGLSPLRYTRSYVVTEEQFDALEQTMRKLGMRVSEKATMLRFGDRRYKKGDKYEILSEPNKQDLEEIVSVVSSANRMADYTIVSLHAHESARDRSMPAQFVVDFAHAVIDAGADVFLVHGPHVLRGIEIYKGKPIFYSLANFIFQNETLLRLPYENYERYDLGTDKHVADFNDVRYNLDKRGFPARADYWESIVAVPHWKGKELYELKLYPITLGFGKPRQARGRPMFADSELSKKIIDDLKKYSEPFRTEIDFQDGIGIVNLASSKSK